MTDKSPSTESMRRSKKIRTPCPKKSGPAHCNVKADVSGLDLCGPEARELVARYRTGEFNELAAKFARRCKSERGDMLNAAMLHALRRPHWEDGVEKRIKGILSSHAYTINRARKRKKRVGKDLVTDKDGIIVDRGFPRPRDPEAELENERRRAGASKALDIIAGDDPQMRALIDGICQRERGRKLRGVLGITELELAALRRRLKRTAQSVCKPLCIDGVIDADLLQDFAA